MGWFRCRAWLWDFGLQSWSRSRCGGGFLVWLGVDYGALGHECLAGEALVDQESDSGHDGNHGYAVKY